MYSISQSVIEAYNEEQMKIEDKIKKSLMDEGGTVLPLL